MRSRIRDRTMVSLEWSALLFLLFCFLIVYIVYWLHWVFWHFKPAYSRVRNKHTPTFINFWNFFQGVRSYSGLKRLSFYYISLHILRGYVYSFCQIFQRLCLFKGLRLFQTLEYWAATNFGPLICHKLVPDHPRLTFSFQQFMKIHQ